MIEGGGGRDKKRDEGADSEMEGGEDGVETIKELERRVKRIKERVTDIERKMELKERADRKRNIIIRGLEVKEGKKREAMEETLERIEVRAEIEEVKKL